MNWTVKGAFNRNYIDGTTLAYREQKERVSFLSGKTSLAWHTTMNLMVIKRYGPNQCLRLSKVWRLGKLEQHLTI